MKIQVDLDGDLWAKFKAKVHHEGKTLGSVVPTIFEPALRAYLESALEPPHKGKFVDEIAKEHAPTSTEFPETISLTERTPPTEPPLPAVKRCDLCDQVVDRLFASAGKRVCYTCWRGALTAGQ